MYHSSLCHHYSLSLYEGNGVCTRKAICAHTHTQCVSHTHKVMMDKEVGTGYVRSMPLLFYTRTHTHTITFTHTDAVTHMNTLILTQKHSHTHVHKHKQKLKNTTISLMWTKEVVLDVRALRRCLLKVNSCTICTDHDWSPSLEYANQI